MSRRRKKKKSQKERLLEDAKQPSADALAMLLRNGGGKHTDSKADENKRKGRLRGAEKKNIDRED